MTIDNDFAEALTAAIRSHSPLPAFPEGLTLDDAYEALEAISASLCNSASPGIKAGLTNPDIQALFGLEHALLGRLYDWGELSPGELVEHRENAQIECEVAVVVDQSGQPVKVAPAIEFVCVNFSQPQDMTPANLVASSLGADRYLLGEFVDWADMDFELLRATTITLTHNGENILSASPYDSLDGPESAVRWGTNEAGKRGMRLSEGSILLCGTCGAGLPLLPGDYSADYGTFGNIEFTVGATSAS